MTIGYRSIIEIAPDKNAFELSAQQFRSWLKKLSIRKNHPVEAYDWEGNGRFIVGKNATLTVIEDRSSEIDRLWLELEHYDRSQTRWTTRLVAYAGHSPKHSRQMILLDCEGRAKDGSVVQPAPPAIVRNVLQCVEAVAGGVPMSDRWQTIHEREFEDLYGYITNPERNLPLVVAAPLPDTPLRMWVNALQSLTHEAYGCAAFFVLDEQAHRALNERLGTSHQIPLGALRTFVPDVHLDDSADGMRHRILTARTLLRNFDSAKKEFSKALTKTIAATPRKYLLEVEIPSELTRTIRLLEKSKLSLDLSEIQSKPQLALVSKEDKVLKRPFGLHSTLERGDHSDESCELAKHETLSEDSAWLLISSMLAERGHAFESIDEVVVSLDTLTARTKRYETDLNREIQERYELEDLLKETQRELEDERFEHAITDEELRKEEKKRRSLENWKASRQDRYEYVEEAPTLYDDVPESVVEIVERLAYDQSGHYQEITKYVVICDPEKAVDDADYLDQNDNDLKAASRLWDCVMVLRDYMKECIENSFRGGMHAYLTSADVVGKKCPPTRHSENESETVQTNAQMRKMREFNVPLELDASGRKIMFAHFKPLTRDSKAPRLYYYADTTITGKAYIGYMGRHLKNTKTN